MIESMGEREALEAGGLSEKEGRIYLELLKAGPINANVLSKLLDIERTVTYNVLNKLIQKGLANYIVKDGKKLFNAAEPENLLKPLKEKEEILNALIPKIKALQKIKPENIAVEVYEGKEALKTLFNIAIKAKEEILIFGGTGRAYKELPFSVPQREKEAISRKLRIRSIFNYDARNHPFTKLLIVKSRHLPKGYENIATTHILGDMVAIHAILKKPVVIMIKNRHIARGYKNVFEFLWKYAKPS